MPALDERAGLFWRTFLRNVPRRYAVILTPDEALRRDQQYPHENDAEDLITDYSARPARWRGRSFCLSHPYDQASLQIYAANGHRSIHCSINLSDCLLARRDRNAAFRVSGIGVGLDSQAASRQLNKRG